MAFIFRNDFGIRTVIAPFFAEIFKNNMIQNGMLPVTLPAEQCKELADDARAKKYIEVDLERCEIRREDGKPVIPFEVDPFRRHCLLNGLDSISLTLHKEGSIQRFEEKRSEVWPWLDGFGDVKGGGRLPEVPTSPRGKK